MNIESSSLNYGDYLPTQKLIIINPRINISSSTRSVRVAAFPRYRTSNATAKCLRLCGKVCSIIFKLIYAAYILIK